MVPQVCTAQELNLVRDYMAAVQKQVEVTYGVKVPCKFGTMIEVVRACMRAENLAEVAEFFSFGTNDLTQATFSFSREDAENKFLPMYNERGILQDNPFEVLDVKGVGRLMALAVEWGRASRAGLKVGICGEHGGHPASIRVLRLDRARLCVVLRAAGADRAARRGPGGNPRQRRDRPGRLSPADFPRLARRAGQSIALCRAFVIQRINAGVAAISNWAP